MSDADRAYKAAQAKIEQARKAGDTGISFDTEECRALTRIPAEISTLSSLSFVYLTNTSITDLTPLSSLIGLQNLNLTRTGINDLRPLSPLTGLEHLRLSQTRISDLSPISTLTELKQLHIDKTNVTDLTPLDNLTGLIELAIQDTKVADLRPLQNLEQLGTYGPPGLTFHNTSATERDNELALLARVKDPQERAEQTLAYLRNLPPWPEPLPWVEDISTDLLPENEAEPIVPPAQPAPLQVLYEDDMLRPAMPGDKLNELAHLRAKQGWDALRDYLADLADQRPRIGNAMPRLEKSMGRLADALGETYESMNPIATGIQGTRFIRLSKGATEALMEEDAADIEEFAAALALFLERFPEWQVYRQDALDHPPNVDLIKSVLPELQDLTGDIAGRPHIDERLPKALESQIETVRDEPEDYLASKGLVASFNNFLGALMDKALPAAKMVKSELGDFSANLWKKAKDGLAGVIVTAVGSAALDIVVLKGQILRSLAQTIPQRFGWLEGFLRWLGL